MISINISEKPTEDDWGFYVDIENANFNNYDNYKKMREKYGLNKNKFNPTLESISEEYAYYLNQQKKENDIVIETKYNVNKTCCIVNVSSTTFITLLITYFVFCVI
jgi:hypothetical protein